MNCMKCGVEIPENQVFCDHCLAVMDDYPIKPDAHIHLPKRETPVEAPKRSNKKKRTLSPEEGPIRKSVPSPRRSRFPHCG